MPRKRLPMVGSARIGRHPTCTWKCGSACFRSPPNQSGNEPFEAVVARVVGRRSLLKGGVAAAFVLGAGCTTGGPSGQEPAGFDHARQAGKATPSPQPSPGALAFASIEPGMVDDVVVPEGYGYEVLIRWGQPILAGAPDFDFNAQTPEAQAGQFGYNCDYVTFIPRQGDQGLLWVNHEYTTSDIMFPDWNPDAPTLTQVNTELAAHGGSIVLVDISATSKG